MLNKILPMTGVEPRTSGIESDRSTNWATTTSHQSILLLNYSIELIRILLKHLRGWEN